MRKGAALWVLGLGWAVGVLASVVPRTAHAWSCNSKLVHAPRHGQENVPTDTLLWGYSADSTRLLGPSGEVIPIEERALVVSYLPVNIPVLDPSRSLQPNTAYAIELDFGYGPTVTEFVTGAGPAEAPPARPALATSEPRVGGGGGRPYRWLDLDFEPADGALLVGTVQAPEVASIRELLLEAPPSDAAVAAAPKVELLSDYGGVSVGIADCAIWPDEAPDSLAAQFGAFDLAGTFSGWVDVPLELPSEAEAQAAADAENAAYAAAEQAARDLRAANLAKLEAASHRGGCAMTAASASGDSPLAMLSLALGVALTAARRKRAR